MAQMSIQSEAFIRIYNDVRPVLERLAKAGFPGAVVTEMSTFVPAKVIEELDAIQTIAKRGIALAGAGASHVVLSENEHRMLVWSSQKADR